MKSKLRIVTAALMLGAAGAAVAQASSRAPDFVEQFQAMQAAQFHNPYLSGHPQLGAASQDPVGRAPLAGRVADLQSESSESARFEPAPALSPTAADPVGHRSFRDAFADMQAASSNSGEFGWRSSADVRSEWTGAARADVVATRQ